jgi:sensor histidine kinase YesM
MRKSQLYILLQFGGWLFYTIIALLFVRVQHEPITLKFVTALFLIYVIGVGSTHFYRGWIQKMEWKKLNISKLIPSVLVSVVILSFIFQALYLLGRVVMFHEPQSLSFIDNISNILNWSFLLGMWSVIYFAYQFFERYRTEEIKNLKWEASKNEIELNKLKSQLNPHFIFNSMNSIRALIDENPIKAKRSVTQLSNILRKTLMMGRKKTVLFEEEMAVVNDFIELEKTRYEERLEFEADIQEEAYTYQIPSLMIQTLIENGIKHGISKLPEGGKINLRANVIEDNLIIEIENTGELIENSKPETGFGIINTTQRLHLLYGDQATFKISNSDNHTVLTRVSLPKEPI